jgi:glycyl-tRNA synthetase (class II)
VKKRTKTLEEMSVYLEDFFKNRKESVEKDIDYKEIYDAVVTIEKTAEKEVGWSLPLLIETSSLGHVVHIDRHLICSFDDGREVDEKGNPTKSVLEYLLEELEQLAKDIKKIVKKVEENRSVK